MFDDARWGGDPRDREDRHRGRDRGASGNRDHSNEHVPGDVFTNSFELPRGRERELVHERNRDYRLNGFDVRALSTVGAFRVVREQDLREVLELRQRDLGHLERQGLIECVAVNGRDRALTLTERGRQLLERHYECDSEHRQMFYSGADRPRERSHDVEVYRAYLKAAERLHDRNARVLQVQLDRELKRDYQRFLQERNRGDRNSDGRPASSNAEIAAWAREHNLPYFDDQVHFPDVRIEYEDANGDVRFEDIEVVTEHYRGAHGASAARCGFTMHVSRGAGGGAFDPRLAEDFV